MNQYVIINSISVIWHKNRLLRIVCTRLKEGSTSKGGYLMPKSFKITLVTQGILIAAITSLILTLILSIIYFFSSIQESTLHSLVSIAISVFAATILVSYQAGSKGLVYGLAIGFGFFILSVIVYYIFYSGNPSWLFLLVKALVSIVAGILGGTLGAVLKRN